MRYLAFYQSHIERLNGHDASWHSVCRDVYEDALAIIRGGMQYEYPDRCRIIVIDELNTVVETAREIDQYLIGQIIPGELISD